MSDAVLTSLPSLARRRRHRVAVLVAAASVALGAAACSPTSTESTTSSSTAAPSTAASSASGSSTPPSDAGSTYATIDELHQAIVDGGFACTLEYPGLTDDVTSNEVSICTIESETAYLTIWSDTADLEDFTSSVDGATGTVAVGANWTVSVTSSALAGRLAAALGGTAPGPS